MKFEKSELQIFANYCVAAAESMAFTLMRTAHSTFVKETEDFSCAITTPGGLTFASPKTLGATWYVGLDYGPVTSMVDQYEPGDIYCTNDPYSGHVATHTPDLVMWKPVFHDGEIVCFVAGHIHNTDMGGAVPASLSRTLTEIHQEGIRFPPTRIVKDGVVDETLLSWMLLNVRAPEQNLGDLKAQLGSLVIGERRIREIIERFGVDVFKAGIEELLAYSEMQARAIVRTIPDGQYFFAEYADEDSVGGKPMRIALNLRVADGMLDFDFSESDPQLASSLNVPTGGHLRHALLLVGLNYILYSLDPNIVLNAGMLRIAKCSIPEGSVLNPIAPAAVGMRSLTCFIVQTTIFGAFARAMPERMPACPASSVSLLNVKTTGPDGRPVMASIGPVGGGAGGSAEGDGSEASGANLAFLRNTPVEINEAEVPIRITEYRLAPDSGGAGEHRGGMGVVMEFKFFAPNSLVTARNRDRTIFGSWGLDGGLAGKTSIFTKNPGKTYAEDLSNTDLVKCGPGDVIRLEGNGGGGYGQPWKRAIDKVKEDVSRGYVSASAARDLYRVAMVNGEVDMEETLRLRAAAVPEQQDDKRFGHNEHRQVHESKWTRERYAVLSEYLHSAPVAWRFFLKHEMFDRLEQRLLKDDVAPGKEIVDMLFAELVQEYPALGVKEVSTI